MKKLKKRTAPAGGSIAKQASAAIREAADKIAAGRTGKPAKPKRKPATDEGDANDGTTYDVRLYATGLMKWDEKRGTRIIASDGGMLTFAHRKPRSTKTVRKCVPLERVLQYGGNSESGWVHLMTRQQADHFTAVSVKRTGKFIEFDLGDGIVTRVNADTDMEVQSVE